MWYTVLQVGSRFDSWQGTLQNSSLRYVWWRKLKGPLYRTIVTFQWHQYTPKKGYIYFNSLKELKFTRANEQEINFCFHENLSWSCCMEWLGAPICAANIDLSLVFNRSCLYSHAPSWKHQLFFSQLINGTASWDFGSTTALCLLLVPLAMHPPWK